MKKWISEPQKAIASIVTIITLGSLIFINSLATTIIVFYSNKNAQSVRNSLKAYYAGYSGLQDALLKLERNKDYSSSFNLSIYNSSDVSVSFSPSTGQTTVTATSTISSVNKKLQSIIEINTTTGLITPTSTEELTF